MSQMGGSRIGGVALNPGGSVPLTFETLSHGPIRKLYLTVAFSLLSTGAAFNLAVSTDSGAAAEGADDMDKVLDALFTFIALFWDAETAAGILPPSQWRTILGVFNKRDFDGSMLNGVQVPISTGSAKAFKVIIPFPVSLESYFIDGTIFQNGARRLSEGRFEFTCASSLTPNVILGNGTAAVSAVSVSVTDETGLGTEDDVGMLWNAKRLPNQKTVLELDDKLRLLVLDADPASTNTATAYNVGDTQLWAPSDFQGKFQSERLIDGGYDLSQRSTPLIWMPRDRRLLDFAAHLGKRPRIEVVSGKSSLTLYDVIGIPATPLAVQKVAQKSAAGGETTMEHPTVPSLPPGSSVPPALAPFLPVRIRPANSGIAPPAGATPAQSPAQAGARVAQRQVVQAQIGEIHRLYMGK